MALYHCPFPNLRLPTLEFREVNLCERRFHPLIYVHQQSQREIHFAALGLCEKINLKKNSIISVDPTEGAYVRLSKFYNEPYPPVETGGYNIDRAYGSPSFPIPIRASLHQFREANLCERR